MHLFTRRSFLTASCGLLVPRIGWSAIDPQPTLHWPLTGVAHPGRETVRSADAQLVSGTGRTVYDGPCPRLDGYSMWFEASCTMPVKLANETTLSTWVALEAYPVNEASLVEWGSSAAGVQLAVDRLGFLTAKVWTVDTRLEVRSFRPVGCERWVHVASTLTKSGVLALFVNGEECARSAAKGIAPPLPAVQEVWMGRARESDVVAKLFPTGVVNGLLREVRIYDVALASSTVRALALELTPKHANLTMDETLFEQDLQRPRYHALPPRAWTNEPHGLVYWRGAYHLFYQKNPNGPYWGHIHWGHMNSPDLLHWTEQPIALAPEPGPDADGCWSGSVLVVNDRLHCFYTGGDGKHSAICMASSDDGVHFIKHPGNPVIEAPPENIGVKEFRDPFVWKQGAQYRMVIGSGITDVGGTTLLYRSTDLVSWTYVKPLLIGQKDTSGIFWEMPVFLKVGDFHVLVVCEVPGRASYWVGTWDDDTFRVHSAEPQRLDLLNHLLSPTPCTDPSGRVMMMGIIPDTRDPREAWQAGWAHLYGLPREVKVTRDYRLQQRPIAEIDDRFTELQASRTPLNLGNEWTLFNVAGSSLHVQAQLTRGTSESVILAFRRSPGREEETLLSYSWQTRMMSLDRTKSSLNPHVKRGSEQVAYMPRDRDQITFDLYLDQSVLEVFVDGEAPFASRMYPTLSESIGLAMCAQGGEASLDSLRLAGFSLASG